MKNSYPLIIMLSLATIFLSNCWDNQSATNENQNSKAEKWNTQAKKVEVAALESISFEEMKTIYEETDFIDIIFYNVDFSMSVNNKSNIQRMVGMVSTNVAQLNPDCQAMGRLFFQKNGALLIEADMYYDKTCQYFVFQKDGKPAYANDITPEGQAYFSQIFSQVKVEPAAGAVTQ